MAFFNLKTPEAEVARSLDAMLRGDTQTWGLGSVLVHTPQYDRNCAVSVPLTFYAPPSTKSTYRGYMLTETYHKPTRIL
jgi:hypothetical protein